MLNSAGCGRIKAGLDASLSGLQIAVDPTLSAVRTELCTQVEVVLLQAERGQQWDRALYGLGSNSDLAQQDRALCGLRPSPVVLSAP